VERLLLTGKLVDLIVGLVGIEAAALLIFRSVTGRGPSAIAMIANLLAGTFLLLALRNALAGAEWGWIAACLTGALAAHLVDLRLRWVEAPPRSSAQRRSQEGKAAP